jgi:hypothetical protein
MTKDDLPPLPEHWMPLNLVGLDVNLWKPAIDRYAEAYARAAIAAHDAKRPKIRIWRHEEGSAWHTSDANPALFPNIEFAWAYIEREGA